MAGVQDAAAYILQRLGPMTAMKLQKLLYFCYGYHLVWEDRPLFPERFEAWANGPVCRELYDRHRGLFKLSASDIPVLGGSAGALDRDEAESVGLVLGGYGQLPASHLSMLTCQEQPWLAARRRGGAVLMERSHEQLADDDIAEHFEALLRVTDAEAQA